MTKKILITGLGAGVTEEGVRSLLGRFGTVVQVDIIREGSADKPLALVEMCIGNGSAAYLVTRLSNYWHEGSSVSARLLHH